MKPYIDYEKYHIESLKNPKDAALYLSAVLEENDPELLLLALADVAKAHGMTTLAQKTKMHRVSLHKMLSKKGNPELKSFLRLLDATGLRLSFKAKAA